MAIKTFYIGSQGPYRFDDANETDEHLVRRGDVLELLTGQHTEDVTVVTNVSIIGNVLYKKTRTLSFEDGTLVSVSAESAWS